MHWEGPDPWSSGLLAHPLAGGSAILGGLSRPHFSLSVFAGKMEGACFRDRDMKRTQPQCVCVCECVSVCTCTHNHAECVMEVILYIFNSMLARFFFPAEPSVVTPGHLHSGSHTLAPCMQGPQARGPSPTNDTATPGAPSSAPLG